MKDLDFEIEILAPRERVWQLMLLDDAGYRDWTSAFCEGSHYQGRWDEGTTIRFLGPNGDGMYALVERSQAPEQVTLRHQGEIKDGQEQAPNGEWSGAEESYFLAAVPAGTQLRVHAQVAPAYAAMMAELWPAALQRLKRLCEQGPAA